MKYRRERKQLPTPPPPLGGVTFLFLFSLLFCLLVVLLAAFFFWSSSLFFLDSLPRSSLLTTRTYLSCTIHTECVEIRNGKTKQFSLLGSFTVLICTFSPLPPLTRPFLCSYSCSCPYVVISIYRTGISIHTEDSLASLVQSS